MALCLGLSTRIFCLRLATQNKCAITGADVRTFSRATSKYEISSFFSLISRGMSTNDKSRRQSSDLSKVAQDSGQVTIGEKVKQTTKDVYYTGIIVVGVGITGVIGYYIFRELFSSQSPNGVYTCAFKECRENSKIVDAVGEPMKGYGELSSRGRRRHVSHVEYMQEDVKCMRMKFYIEGSRRKGTVHLEVKQNLYKTRGNRGVHAESRRISGVEGPVDYHSFQALQVVLQPYLYKTNSSGKYDYRYLFVELDGYPRETIILKDNR